MFQRPPQARWNRNDGLGDDDSWSPLTGDDDTRPRRSETVKDRRAKRLSEMRGEVDEAIKKVEKLRITTDNDALYANFLRAIMDNTIAYPNSTGASKCALVLDVVHGMLKHHAPTLATDPETWSGFLAQVAAAPEVTEEFDAMLGRLGESLFDNDEACGAPPKRPADVDLYELAPKRRARTTATGLPLLPNGLVGLVGLVGQVVDGTSTVLTPILTFLVYFIARFVVVERYDVREMAKDASIVAFLAVAMHFALETGQAFDAFDKGWERDRRLLLGLTPENDPWLAWHPTSAQIRRAINALGVWEEEVSASVRAGRAAACGITGWTPEKVMEKLGELFQKNKNALGGTTYSECQRAMESYPGFATLADTFDTNQDDPNLVLYKGALMEHIRAMQAGPENFLLKDTYAAYARIVAGLLGLLFFSRTALGFDRRQRAPGLGEAFDHLSVVEHVFARHRMR